MCVYLSAWACVECVLVDGRYDDLELVRQIGQGGFSFVFEATHRESGERLALKVPRPQVGLGAGSFPVELQQKMAKEVTMMMKCDHPSVVRCLGLVSGGPSGVAVAMELCTTSLESRLLDGTLSR